MIKTFGANFSICALVLLLSFLPNIIYAEPIPIPFSSDIGEVIFDGKWSHTFEWKQSTLTKISYDDGAEIMLRTAHQGNFVYVLVDFVTDVNPDKGIDMSIICFDGKNEKSLKADENDFCFSVSLYSKNAFVYQGGSPTAVSQNFKKISHPDYIAIASMSDENDRYSKIPHTTYEFKIPIELMGRSNIYGFYMATYDSNSDTIYTWPKDSIPDKLTKTSSPDSWGEIFSPDKSLPEFEWPILVLIPIIAFVIYLSKIKNKLIFHNNF